MIYQYIFVLLSLIEDMLYWACSTFCQKSKDLLFSNTFLHFLCKKICTVCLYFLYSCQESTVLYSNSGFYHSIRNWPVHLFNILASYLNMTWMFWLHDLVFWLHIRIYCVSRVFSIPFIVVLSMCTVLALCKNCNNSRLVKSYCLLVVIKHLEYYLGREYMILYEILVTTLYFPFVVPRYHLKPLLGLILQII